MRLFLGKLFNVQDLEAACVALLYSAGSSLFSMRSFLVALLLAAIANVIHKTYELRHLRGLEWTWFAFMVIATVAIETVEFKAALGKSGRHGLRLALQVWGPRLLIIAALAFLRTDAEVVRAATAQTHRSEIREALKHERTKIESMEDSSRSNDKAWHDMISRKELLDDALLYVDTSEDLDDLAKHLDGNASNFPALGPIRGYQWIVERKLRITEEEHERQWAGHISDLLLALFWLLLPYVVASAVLIALEKAAEKPLQGELFTMRAA